MKTDRITLRPWRESDAETLFMFAKDPDVGPRAGWRPHASEEESRAIILSVFSNPTTWAIVWNETSKPIGAIGYGESCNCALPARPDEPTIGYWVARPFWNMGICTEALTLLVGHLKKDTHHKSVVSGHFVDNPASGRVMEKCGFIPTGEYCYDENLYEGKDKKIRVLRLELNG